MFRRPHFWQNPQWRKALNPDLNLAEAEGRAAGTGLLTGEIARGAERAMLSCPECDGASDVLVIDLVGLVVTRRCHVCGHRWDTDEPARTFNRR